MDFYSALAEFGSHITREFDKRQEDKLAGRKSRLYRLGILRRIRLLLCFIRNLFHGLSQMTFFDFAVIITLGSVTANLAMGQNSTPVSAATVLLTLCI
jgi:hypothetical protein